MKKLSDELPVLSLASSWSDEQWAEHDAKIAAQRAEESRPATAMPETLKASAGWPVLSLQNLKTVDETMPGIQQLSRWNHSAQPIAVLSGGVGCGKTTAATHWANKHVPRALFVRASTFARASRYGAERDAWISAPGLILDDLGTEYADQKGALVGDLEELIDVFYGDEKPLLITTNLPPPVFTERYGERITDRLRQHGRWLSVMGESLRRKHA